MPDYPSAYHDTNTNYPSSYVGHTIVAYPSAYNDSNGHYPSSNSQCITGLLQ